MLSWGVGVVVLAGCSSYPPASLDGRTDEYPCFPDCIQTFTKQQCEDEAHAQGCTGVIGADNFTCASPSLCCNVFCWSDAPSFNCAALAQGH